jgi:hypothetical protein
MALAPLALLAAVIPAFGTAPLGGLDRVTVDAYGAGPGLTSRGHADRRAHGLHHLRPGPVVTPLGQIGIDRAFGKQVMRQHIPWATTAVLRQDRGDHVAPVDRARTPATLGSRGRNQRFHDGPWLVRHIRGLWLAGLSFLPHSCALLGDRGCVNDRSKHLCCHDLFPDSLLHAGGSHWRNHTVASRRCDAKPLPRQATGSAEK